MSPEPAHAPAVVGGGGETWMTLHSSGRGGTQRWAWDLDDLCAGAAP